MEGLEGWARQATQPSEEEIERVRYLIGWIREAMRELELEERAELQELLSAERTNRSAILERLPARHELNVLNVGATFPRGGGLMACTEHLRAHHSLRSQQKREAVLSAARVMIRSGIPIEWAALARRAGVSEKFIHDKKHAAVC